MPNHLTGEDPESVVAPDERAQVRGRSMLVKRLKPSAGRGRGARLPGRQRLEGVPGQRRSLRRCACRRAWATPAGCRSRSSRRRPRPRWATTTRTSASSAWAQIIGAGPGGAGARRLAHALRGRRRVRAERKGIIIADTKFEFGLDARGTLTLMDEVLTPDSSRFWPQEGYARAVHDGRNPPSYEAKANEVVARVSSWLAFVDYTNINIPSLIPNTREALSTLTDENLEATARANLTTAQVFHLCGDKESAVEFYKKARVACLGYYDDVMLAALIHNMAWLRMAARRNAILQGISSEDEGYLVELAAESTSNYEKLIGSKSFDVMTPLLGAQVDIMFGRYVEAIYTISARLEDLRGQGLSGSAGSARG